MPKKDSRELFCNFCNKSQKEVRKLIAGPSVYICDECVELCNDIITEEADKEGYNGLGMYIPKPKIKAHLDDYIIGQRKLKVLSVAVHNHYKRIESSSDYDDVGCKIKHLNCWSYRNRKNTIGTNTSKVFGCTVHYM